MSAAKAPHNKAAKPQQEKPYGKDPVITTPPDGVRHPEGVGPSGVWGADDSIILGDAVDQTPEVIDPADDQG